jgi:hypothetical protein
MASKRPVAPDTPIRSFPTPNVEDLLVVVDVDSRLPGYKPLDYGTPHPDQTRFQGAKLVYQEPLDGSDQFVRRIYATDRADQDTYNYAIKYSAGSPGHPIYIRTYVEPRASYKPLADGSADSVFPDAFLVEEEMQPVEGELNSLYVKVSRVFETLPGPVLTSFETNEAGQKVTVTTQRKSSADYSLPAASATSNPSAQAEDTGVVTEQIRTVPSIFARKQFSAERPDMLPQKFRAAVPDVEVSELVTGTAEQPVLLQGDISASQTQQSVFVKQVSRRSRTSPTYPRVITETTATRSGQLATVTSTLDDSIQTADTGPLVESSEVTDLGDGRSIKVTTEVDEVFDQPSFTRAKEDLTPPKFRATVTETVEERTVTGSATMPASLSGDEISKTEEQLTLDRKRVRTQERAIGTTSTLNEFVLTPEGQLATRTLTLSNQPQTVTPSATLLQGEIEQLGDGRTVRTEVTVPSVFDERRVAKEKPDLVPQEFRGAVPTETTEVVQTGTTATMPTLGPGELARAEQRITANKVRTSTTTRPSTALPVTLTPSDTLLDNDGVAVTRVKTLASGAQTFTPSATVSGTIESIGDGLTVRTVDTKAEVFGSQLFSKERPENIPVEFRATVPETVAELTEPGVAGPVTLSGAERAKTVQQVNKFTKRTRTVTRDSTTSGVLDFGEQVDQDGVKVSVVRTLAEGAQPISASATVSGTVEDIGDGKTIQTLLTKEEVFGNQSFTQEKPETVPAEFRATVPDSVVEVTEPGIAQPVTLSGNEIAKTEQQATKFTKRTRTVTRNATTSGVLDLGEQIDNDGIKVSVVRTLAEGAQPITPSATVSGTVEDIGDGKTVKTLLTKAEVFGSASFTKAKEDLTPQKFRASVAEEVVEETVPGTAAMPPSLASEEFEKSEQQVNKFLKRTRTRVRQLGENNVLTESVVTPDGQLATRTLTLSDQSQTVSPSATLLEGSIEELGDGRTVKTEVAVASVFDEQRLAVEKPDLVPQEFRGAVPTQTTEVVETGTSISMPTLSSGELARARQRLTEHKVRTSVTTRPVSSLPVTLTPSDTIIDNDGVTVTRVKTLASGTQSLTPSATVSGSVENIGDGLTVRTRDTKAEVFDGTTRAIERPDIVPPKFKVAIPTVTTESTVAGTATTPTLSGGQIAKTEQQLTKFTKRVSTTERASSVVAQEPYTNVGGAGSVAANSVQVKGAQFTTDLGGGYANVIETYPFVRYSDYTSNQVPDFGTISDEIENLGDGTVLRRQVILPTQINNLPEFDDNGNQLTAETMPLLVGQEYDQELDIVIPYKQLVARPSDITVVAGNRRRVTPRDVSHSEVVRYDVEDAQDSLDNYYLEVPDMISVTLPDKLISIGAAANGSKAVSAAPSANGDTYSYSQSKRNSVGATITYNIEEGFSGVVPTVRAVFFLPKGSASPQNVLTRLQSEREDPQLKFWPNVRPRGHQIAIIETSTFEETSASVSFDSEATATSTGATVNTNVTNIPPTIHGLLPIAISGGLDGAGTVSINPSSLAATAYTTFPTGWFLYQINATPYRFSYVRVDALLVNITSSYV